MKDKIRIAICEDEVKWRDEIVNHLIKYKNEYEYKMAWEYFNDPSILLDEYKRSEHMMFDIIITDIEMSNLSGVNMANEIRNIDENVIIIFLTQYTKYMRDCFASQPFRFWEKPVEYDLFKKDMNAAVKKITNIHHGKVFAFVSEGIAYRIPYNEIYYFSADLKRVVVHLKDKDYTFIGKMKNYAERWIDNGFICCHRSYFVNIEYVEHLEKSDLYLTNGEWMPVSQSHLNDVKAYILEADCREAIKKIKEKGNI